MRVVSKPPAVGAAVRVADAPTVDRGLAAAAAVGAGGAVGAAGGGIGGAAETGGRATNPICCCCCCIMGTMLGPIVCICAGYT